MHSQSLPPQISTAAAAAAATKQERRRVEACDICTVTDASLPPCRPFLLPSFLLSFLPSHGFDREQMRYTAGFTILRLLTRASVHVTEESSSSSALCQFSNFEGASVQITECRHNRARSGAGVHDIT